MAGSPIYYIFVQNKVFIMNTPTREVAHATIAELPEVVSLINAGRRVMREHGNLHQWDDNHPSVDQLREDIEHGYCHLLKENGMCIATFAFVPGPDITYRKIEHGEWIDNEKPYYVIHRVASLPDHHGVMADILGYCFAHTDNIRIDTHRDNLIMQHSLHKAGFCYCGIIHLLNGDERVAYQKIIM